MLALLTLALLTIAPHSELVRMFDYDRAAPRRWNFRNRAFRDRAKWLREPLSLIPPSEPEPPRRP
jgi:hypothetical protein